MIENATPATPGGRVELSATVWNAMREAATLVLRDRLRNSAGVPYDPLLPATTVIARNNSGSSVVAGGVLSITDATAEFPSFPTEARRGPVVVAGTPSAASSPFVITTEPAAASQLVRAVISGVTCCTVEILSTSHNYAAPKPGSTSKLISCPSGPARILARATGGTGDIICMVNLLGSDGGEQVALIKCTSNTVNGDGYQPGTIRVKDDAGGRSDGATVWMKATTGDQFRNNIEYILFLNGTVTSASSTRALYDGPASSGFEFEVCVDAVVQTNRLWVWGGIELEEDV